MSRPGQGSGEFVRNYDIAGYPFNPCQFTCQFSGDIWPMAAVAMEWAPLPNSSENEMNMMGAEAVSKAAPGESPMSLVTSLVELKKEGLPSLIGSTTWKDRTSAAKKAGDEYLNVQFGWKPLINDVQSLAHVVTSSDSILKQLERDSGRVVHRRLTLKEDTEYDETDLGVHGVSLAGELSSVFMNEKYPPGRVTRIDEIKRKVWFSGSFTYYLPSRYDSRDRLRSAAERANLVLGLEPTPTVLWNLAPWSWAVDYFSNAGDVIHNCERLISKELIMHYGYLMEHAVHRRVYMAENSAVLPITFISESKARVRANPFGFGVSFDNLSNAQTAILAALGMSRGG